MVVRSAAFVGADRRFKSLRPVPTDRRCACPQYSSEYFSSIPTTSIPTRLRRFPVVEIAARMPSCASRHSGRLSRGATRAGTRCQIRNTEIRPQVGWGVISSWACPRRERAFASSRDGSRRRPRRRAQAVPAPESALGDPRSEQRHPTRMQSCARRRGAAVGGARGQRLKRLAAEPITRMSLEHTAVRIRAWRARGTDDFAVGHEASPQSPCSSWHGGCSPSTRSQLAKNVSPSNTGQFAAANQSRSAAQILPAAPPSAFVPGRVPELQARAPSVRADT